MNDPIEFAEQARREEAELWNPQLRDDRIERELQAYIARALRGDTEWTEHLDDNEAAEAIGVIWKTCLTLFDSAVKRHEEVLREQP